MYPKAGLIHHLIRSPVPVQNRNLQLPDRQQGVAIHTQDQVLRVVAPVRVPALTAGLLLRIQEVVPIRLRPVRVQTGAVVPTALPAAQAAALHTADQAVPVPALPGAVAHTVHQAGAAALTVLPVVAAVPEVVV